MSWQKDAIAAARLLVRELAQLKGTDPETVERVTWENALRLYGLI